MVELTVGSRFYYKDKLYEVKIKNNPFICTGCVFAYTKKCKKIKCSRANRHDNKYVYFEEVKNV